MRLDQLASSSANAAVWRKSIDELRAIRNTNRTQWSQRSCWSYFVPGDENLRLQKLESKVYKFQFVRALWVLGFRLSSGQVRMFENAHEIARQILHHLICFWMFNTMVDELACDVLCNLTKLTILRLQTPHHSTSLHIVESMWTHMDLSAEMWSPCGVHVEKNVEILLSIPHILSTFCPYWVHMTPHHSISLHKKTHPTWIPTCVLW
jgi:hypothetical protein